MRACSAAGEVGVSRRLIERMLAAHLELPNASALAGSSDAELEQAVKFVERFRGQVAMGEADGPGCYGQRARARALAWTDSAHADEQDAPPLVRLQALLSVLDEDGHDVRAVRDEYVPLIGLPPEAARQAAERLCASVIERARTASS